MSTTKKTTKSKPATKPRRGRPSVFDEKLQERYCLLLLEGFSERQICQREDMPSLMTVLRYKDRDPNFAGKCARAKETGIDRLIDEMEALEKKVEEGTMDARAASVSISSKQWRAMKLAPKKYGTKLDLTSSDGSMSPARTPKEVALELIKQVDGLPNS